MPPSVLLQLVRSSSPGGLHCLSIHPKNTHGQLGRPLVCSRWWTRLWLAQIIILTSAQVLQLPYKTIYKFLCGAVQSLTEGQQKKASGTLNEETDSDCWRSLSPCLAKLAMALALGDVGCVLVAALHLPM